MKMNETTTQKEERREPAPAKEPGFFGRIVRKLDNSLKQKAEEKSQQGSCCGGGGADKGGKCC